ncbi:MAG: ankyrin repeat domain-containing protein [Sodalis sp. (in: enterobacteria)]|uniref:ankyrin repeat domain-containing protein n=1 Tax=Sodalis sp. (in: enterobacteria) TaxID=1898979 RepID=UPI003F3028E7
MWRPSRITPPLQETSRCRPGVRWHAGIPQQLPSRYPCRKRQNSGTSRVNTWLRSRPAIDTPDAHGFTALQHAVRNGRAEAVNILLTHNASLSVITPNRETLLHLAAMSGHLAVLETMAAYCKKAVNQADNGAWTPLMCMQYTTLTPGCVRCF